MINNGRQSEGPVNRDPLSRAKSTGLALLHTNVPKVGKFMSLLEIFILFLHTVGGHI